jgi:2'-5' RNA ligase
MLFIAIQPPPSTAERIASLGTRFDALHEFARGPFPPHRLHVSLCGLGNHTNRPDGLISYVRLVAEKIRVPRFTATFNRAMTFNGRSSSPIRLPFVITARDDIVGFFILKRAIDAALGIPTTAAFTPHITLLYDTKIVEPTVIDPISWEVEEFVLVHALIKEPNRPKQPYSIVGRWKLI